MSSVGHKLIASPRCFATALRWMPVELFLFVVFVQKIRRINDGTICCPVPFSLQLISSGAWFSGMREVKKDWMTVEKTFQAPLMVNEAGAAWTGGGGIGLSSCPIGPCSAA
jgi:hypothetical protein